MYHIAYGHGIHRAHLFINYKWAIWRIIQPNPPRHTADRLLYMSILWFFQSDFIVKLHLYVNKYLLFISHYFDFMC